MARLTRPRHFRLGPWIDTDPNRPIAQPTKSVKRRRSLKQPQRWSQWDCESRTAPRCARGLLCKPVALFIHPNSPMANLPLKRGEGAPAYTAKELPHPQVVVAFGLRITNCAALRAGFALQTCRIVHSPQFAYGEFAPQEGRRRAGLHGEGVAAPTGGGRIRIANHELRAFHTVREIDLGAGEVEHAHGIDQ